MLNTAKSESGPTAFPILYRLGFYFIILGFLTSPGNADTGLNDETGKKDQYQIYISPFASQMETFTSMEIQRYVYLRTDRILPIVKIDIPIPPGSKGILAVQKDSTLLSETSMDLETLKILHDLGEQEYILKTIRTGKNNILLICEGDALGTLYGAYRFAEHLGVRFYLDGDVIPDQKFKFEIPELDETAKPLFPLRGIQPFHDFAEGPDWWSGDDYKSVIAQLPKLRMNFIGLHTFPEKAPHAEPTVWIGLSKDIDPDGNMRMGFGSAV
jgi:hypothetical protein